MTSDRVARDLENTNSAEVKLSETQLLEIYRQVCDLASIGVAKLGRDWRVLYLNRKGKELVAPSGDIQGRILWNCFPAMVYEGSPWVEHHHRSMYEGVITQFEEFYPEPLNLWVDITLTPAEDGLIVFFHDASERRQAHEALRQATQALAASEEELRWTVELSAQIPWTADPGGRMLDFNKRWPELTGLTREQALGQGWMQAPHPDDLPRLVGSWAHSLRTGEPYDVEHRIRTASGEFRWMRSRAFPRRDKNGNIVKWYGTTEDIHERKRAEDALMQSEKLAAVGRIASTIAHEINNPLESVTNLVYLARQQSQDPEQQRLLDMADEELQRVSLIANQTLRFHKQASKPQAVSCTALFSTVLNMYGGRLKNANIAVEKRKRANEPVICFEGDIRQVLNNLVDNAIDAMPRGGRLLVRSRQGTDWRTGRPGLILTVADTGAGIDPQARGRIFEAFYTTKGIGGTGLGLWISAEIMHRHQGRLLVRSSQKAARHGTAVSLFLPTGAGCAKPNAATCYETSAT